MLIYTLSSPLGVEDVYTGRLDATNVIRGDVLYALNHGAEYVDVSHVDDDNVVWTERHIPENISDNGSVWSSVVTDSWWV